MINTVIFSLISIMITIGIGYYAGWRKVFSNYDNKKLVKLIMNYALPLSIFTGIWSTPRKIIVDNISIGLWLLIGMIGSFIALILIYKYVFHNPNDNAVLKSLSVSEPSIPFIGAALLPFLLNMHIAAITIGVAALLTNVVMLPATLIMLSVNGHRSFRDYIFNTIKQPLVFSAFSSFILALAGFKMPKECINIFMNLGKTAGGLAMFSIGILLATHKIMANISVGLNVISKNIIIPVIVWALMILFKVPNIIQVAVVISLAIPTASLPSMLAVRYDIDESEIASIKFWSTLFSFITIFGFILCIK